VAKYRRKARTHAGIHDQLLIFIKIKNVNRKQVSFSYLSRLVLKGGPFIGESPMTILNLVVVESILFLAENEKDTGWLFVYTKNEFIGGSPMATKNILFK